MSLINQMLSDLEERRGGVHLDDREVLGGLSAASTAGIIRNVRAPIGVLGLVAAVGLIGAGAVWLRPALERWSPIPAAAAPARSAAAPKPHPAVERPASSPPVGNGAAQPMQAAAQAKPAVPTLSATVKPPPRRSTPIAAEPVGPAGPAVQDKAAVANVAAHRAGEAHGPPAEQPSADAASSDDSAAPPLDEGVAQAFGGKTLTFAHAAPVSSALSAGGPLTADAVAADTHMGPNAKRSPVLDATLIHRRHDHGAAASPHTMRTPMKTPAAGSARTRPAPSVASKAASTDGSVEIKPRRASAQQLSQTLYQAALHKLQAGEPAAAEIALRKALMEDKNNTNARSMLAAVLVQKGRTKAAEQLLHEGLVLLPGEVHFAMQYARILVDQGKVRSALEVLEQAEPDGSANPQYLAFEGALWQRVGEHRHAVTAYRAALDDDPHNGLWWMGLGISLQALHHRDDALDAFRIALQDRSLGDQLRKFVTSRIRSLSSGKS